MGQTGLWDATSSLDRVDPPGELGPELTLSWLNIGPPSRSEEDRTIRQVIYLYAHGGPVIHTPEQVGLEGWGGEVTGWHRAPAELGETLRALGVPTEGSTVAAPTSVLVWVAATAQSSFSPDIS